MVLMSEIIITVAVIISMVIAVGFINPMLEENNEQQKLNIAKQVLTTIDTVIQDLAFEGVGAKRILRINSLDGTLMISGTEDKISVRLPLRNNIVQPGSQNKEGNLYIGSGPKANAYEANINGVDSYVLENEAAMFAVKKLGNSTDWVFINTSGIITAMQNKRLNAILTPTTTITVNDDPKSSYGYGYTEFTRSGLFLSSAGIRLVIKADETLENRMYEVLFTLDGSHDFVESEIQFIHKSNLPEISIDNSSVMEDDVNMLFTVNLNVPTTRFITVDYVTNDGTATTADNDYVYTTGTLTFNPGETTKTISVSINSDTNPESDENFTVILSNAKNATITDGNATGTIIEPAITTIYLVADQDDMSCRGNPGNPVVVNSLVTSGRDTSFIYDGYVRFSIPQEILNANSISSITLTMEDASLSTGNNIRIYAIQDEDASAPENTNYCSSERTANNVVWSVPSGAGSKTSPDVKTVFNEWIADYQHSNPPDNILFVLDDNGASIGNAVYFKDKSHGQYSDSTYLTINYVP